MTKKQNLTFRNAYLHIAKSEVKAKVQKVIDNFAARRIRNFETAKTRPRPNTELQSKDRECWDDGL